jgi:hypothetical protein
MNIGKFFIVLLAFNVGFSLSNTSIAVGLNLNQMPQSCTIFTAAIGDRVLFGNNEDYYLDGTYMWFFPSQPLETPNGTIQTHGAMFFGFDNNNHPGDGYVQGGMNDQGLCYDANGLPVIPLNPHPEQEESHQYFHLFLEILWECSTVNETIDWFESHYLGNAIGCQMHFADASGDAVVISGGDDGELAYTHIDNSTYLVSTNFNLANHSNGWYPCWRYEAATFFLEDISSEEDLTVETFEYILDIVSVDETSYSNIFDPIQRDIYVYYEHNFNKVVRLNLYEELLNLTIGMNGEPTTLGYNTWVLGGLTSNAIRIKDLFPTNYPWFPEPPDPEISPNPWLLLPLVIGIVSITISLGAGTIYGFIYLLKYLKKHRI